MKTALKKATRERQAGKDAISGEPLAVDLRLVDTDRITPKAEGGTYDEGSNVRLLEPRVHMERHGTLRDREEELEELKARFDDRTQIMQLALKINNQLLAFERRTDYEHPDTAEFLRDQLAGVERRRGQLDRVVAKAVQGYPDPLSQAALKIKGVGPITVAGLAVYVDMEKAPNCSSLWSYVGLHCASHERYTKGTASGGNKTLRTILYNTACVFLKLGEGPYRDVYDRTKARLSVSEKVVKTRNTQGQLIEAAWKDTKPSHRHGAALRAIVKHFLADYWFVGRELAGLPTRPLYVQEKLGHTGIVSPRERGWEF